MDDPSRLAQEHYENFPVGSLLLPRRLRPAVHRLYAFARTADDLADEARDLEGLRAYRRRFLAALGERGIEIPPPHEAPSGERPEPLLRDLATSLREHGLSPRLCLDLLDAFEQDCHKRRYAADEELLAYCRLSADPVGRLMLELFLAAEPENLRLSDRICTGLQILNHLQDLGTDYRARDRIYLPQDRMRAHGIRDEDLGAEQTPEALRVLVGEMSREVAEAFAEGWELTRRLQGRFGLEIRGILHGACRVLTRMQRSGHRVLESRPRLHRWDAPGLLLRSLFQSWPPTVLRPSGR